MSIESIYITLRQFLRLCLNSEVLIIFILLAYAIVHNFLPLMESKLSRLAILTFHVKYFFVLALKYTCTY